MNLGSQRIMKMGCVVSEPLHWAQPREAAIFEGEPEEVRHDVGIDFLRETRSLPTSGRSAETVAHTRAQSRRVVRVPACHPVHLYERVRQCEFGTVSHQVCSVLPVQLLPVDAASWLALQLPLLSTWLLRMVPRSQFWSRNPSSTLPWITLALM